MATARAGVQLLPFDAQTDPASAGASMTMVPVMAGSVAVGRRSPNPFSWHVDRAPHPSKLTP
jgi:hypothetical protein